MQKLPIYPAPLVPDRRCGLYKTEGIIIKTADHTDLDRLLTIYTKKKGKISARAISARKKESKLRALLMPFTHSQLLLAKSRTIDIVTDAYIVDSFSYLHQSLERLALAFYISELIDKLVVAPEPDENLWRLISKAFQVLNDKRYKPQKIKKAFEIRLLEVLGYGQLEKQKPIDFIQGLAGEEIKSTSFLKALSLIS